MLFACNFELNLNFIFTHRDRQLKAGLIPLDDCFFIPHRIYILTQAIFAYYLPILFMVYFYIRIVYSLYKSQKQIQKMLSTKDKNNSPVHKMTTRTSARHENNPNGKCIGITNPSFQDNDNQLTANSNVDGKIIRNVRKGSRESKYQITEVQLTVQNKRNAKHKRITQTLGVIILVYLICWLPFCLSWPIQAFCECVNIRFYDFTYWAAYINSTLNPILYFIINRDFREALKRLILKTSRSHENSVYSTDSTSFKEIN